MKEDLNEALGELKQAQNLCNACSPSEHTGRFPCSVYIFIQNAKKILERLKSESEVSV